MSYPRIPDIAGSAERREASLITDVRVNKVSSIPFIASISAILAAVTVGLVLFPLNWTSPIYEGLLIGALIAPLLVVAMAYNWRRDRRRIHHLIESERSADVADLAVRATAFRIHLGKGMQIIELAKALAAGGHKNQTLRLWWTHAPRADEPISVVFEPRLIDEADAGFIRFEGSLATDGMTEQYKSADDRRIGDVSAWRAMRKNVLMKGGWLIFAVTAFIFFTAAFDAYRTRRITLNLVIWGGSLLLTPAIPVSWNLRTSTQWFLIPGGLLLRKAKLRALTSSLHVFDRRESVLCLYQHRRDTWWLAVADDTENGGGLLTGREAMMLLRAWASPLPPPDEEKLADFR